MNPPSVRTGRAVGNGCFHAIGGPQSTGFPGQAADVADRFGRFTGSFARRAVRPTGAIGRPVRVLTGALGPPVRVLTGALGPPVRVLTGALGHRGLPLTR
ncbi:hypothetical protein [Streptomyces roseoviridis]|uniref:Uncharacterized protein n=1 Tax=Streptomyces roseoviridis TaxID=67361 RepID=A0ABV5QVA2_9ACTN